MKLVAVGLSILMVVMPVAAGGPVVASQQTLQPDITLAEAIEKPYLELFALAGELSFSEGEIEAMRDRLDDAEDTCVDRFEEKAEDYEEERDNLQKDLRERTAEIDETERHGIHCRIQNLRILEKQAEMLADTAIPVAYDNREAKLELIEEWPETLAEIRRTIARGEHHDREFGDVLDIGFRDVGDGQEDDVEDGEEAIERMERNGVLPPEVENDVVTEYVEDLTAHIAASSDMRVPVKVRVLNAKEINAFALPGGFLFLQRGLLEAVEDESQLAGVIAHEIAHTAARHGNQLMKRQSISNIIYQVAQVAALVFTGGAAGIGTYYALQYGFTGLGLLLSLDLLGVSRDFELEADRLGIQYAWNAGYDPDGFIRFFDKMATREGYVNGASWFRTHPPFYERMVESQREIMYLPEDRTEKRDGADFDTMKRALEDVVAEAAEEEENRPSLRAPEQGCAEPDTLVYEPGQPVETICADGVSQD